MAEDLSSKDSDEELNDSDWEEMETDGESILCLFCSNLYRSCEDVFEHCSTSHGFNIGKVKSELQLDCFSYIKLINYLRKVRVPSEALCNSSDLHSIFIGEEYMKPQLENDGLLMFDIEDVTDLSRIGNFDLQPTKKIVESGLSDNAELPCKLREMEMKLKETEVKLQLATLQVNQMREVVMRCLDQASCKQFDHSCTSNDTDVGDGGNGYFECYAHFSIHYEMLQDTCRTTSYMDSILKNPNVFDKKTVLDVGCGTGILSMFATKGGASLVVGVDNSDIIFQAMDIIRENKLQDGIKLVKGRIEDVDLPVDSVDIIISEWMGYFLLFESMLDSVLYARDKYLTKEGVLLPNRCSISVAGLSNIDNHKRLITFWDDVYGFKMSSMKKDVVKEVSVEAVNESSLITDSAVVLDLNLASCRSQDTQFSTTFQLKALRDGPLTGFVGWFDTFFDLEHKVLLSTSPSSPLTHWKQTVFYLMKPYEMSAGAVINCKLTCSRWSKDLRSLKIIWSFEDQQHTFILQ